MQLLNPKSSLLFRFTTFDMSVKYSRHVDMASSRWSGLSTGDILCPLLQIPWDEASHPLAWITLACLLFVLPSVCPRETYTIQQAAGTHLKQSNPVTISLVKGKMSSVVSAWPASTPPPLLFLLDTALALTLIFVSSPLAMPSLPVSFLYSSLKHLGEEVCVGFFPTAQPNALQTTGSGASGWIKDHSFLPSNIPLQNKLAHRDLQLSTHQQIFPGYSLAK